MTDVIEKPALNGVNTPTLLATINAVAGQRELADFTFRARASWVSGTHSRIVVDDFFGAGQEHRHEAPTVTDADHPAVLVGSDNGPTPVEFLLQGLAACLTAGIGNIAAVRGVNAVVQFLVDHGGDLNAKNRLGWTPLMLADGMYIGQTEKEQPATAAFIRELLASPSGRIATAGGGRP